jgi:hypothetical protein
MSRLLTPKEATDWFHVSKRKLREHMCSGRGSLGATVTVALASPRVRSIISSSSGWAPVAPKCCSDLPMAICRRAWGIGPAGAYRAGALWSAW